jgi:hypothetical protein
MDVGALVALAHRGRSSLTPVGHNPSGTYIVYTACASRLPTFASARVMADVTLEKTRPLRIWIALGGGVVAF